MDLVVWEERYSVGVTSIDVEHQRLINLINCLYTEINAETDHAVFSDITDDILIHALVHFRHEELEFRRTNYQNAEDHIKEHTLIIYKILKIQEKCHDTKDVKALAKDTLNILIDWLMDHILQYDRLYITHFKDFGAE